MKKILLVIGCFVILLNNTAQVEFFGMTSEGGLHNAGVIFKTDASGDNLTVQHELYMVGAASPVRSGLVQASNGMLYGMTRLGGLNEFGIIFQYDPLTTTYTQKFSFNATDGAFPYGSLIQASNGKLYGMTFDGGANSAGVLFEFDPATNGYAVKFNFDGATTGANPQGSLMQATDGKLYGLTWYGGANNVGTLFCYDPVTNVTTKKVDLSANDGCKPTGTLIQGTDNNLYGYTREGGTNNYGTLFQYDPISNIYTKKVDFITSNGSMPDSKLLLATDGKMYGTIQYGGSNNVGVLFQYDPVSSLFNIKTNFGGSLNLSSPLGGLIQTPDGMFYGISGNSLFQYNPVSDVYAIKNNFQVYSEGIAPNGSLTFSSDGKIYGMTEFGGVSTKGVVYQYDPTTEVTTKKVDFYSSPLGRTPTGSLIKTTNGNLYGLTSAGGSLGMGTIFQFDRLTNTYTKKIEFDGIAKGKNPNGNLTLASDGMLYGMTSEGGNFDMGVLFKYDPITNTYTKKIDFNSANGRAPMGALISATDGNLYGLTQGGGAYDFGLLFKYNVGSGTITNLYDFYSVVSGNSPIGSLVQASDGKLYGTTMYGAGGGGTIFQYDIITNTFNVKHYFVNSLDGDFAGGTLVQANDGKLYGTTKRGGVNDDGVLFQFDISTDTYIKKFDFTLATTGSMPVGILLKASDGNLYGMAQYGGTYYDGTLFQYNPTISTFLKKMDFNGVNGKTPLYNALIEVDALIGLKENNNSYNEVSLYPNPNNGKFTIDLKTKSDVVITNTLGEIVFNQSLEIGKQNLSIQSKADGIYFVKVTDDKGFSSTKKIVVQK